MDAIRCTRVLAIAQQHSYQQSAISHQPSAISNQRSATAELSPQFTISLPEAVQN
jgi:hypothetical protein